MLNCKCTLRTSRLRKRNLLNGDCGATQDILTTLEKVSCGGEFSSFAARFNGDGSLFMHPYYTPYCFLRFQHLFWSGNIETDPIGNNIVTKLIVTSHGA